jgi:hypothetical protein
MSITNLKKVKRISKCTLRLSLTISAILPVVYVCGFGLRTTHDIETFKRFFIAIILALIFAEISEAIRSITASILDNKYAKTRIYKQKEQLAIEKARMETILK